MLRSEKVAGKWREMLVFGRKKGRNTKLWQPIALFEAELRELRWRAEHRELELKAELNEMRLKTSWKAMA